MICWVCAGASFWGAAGALGLLAVVHLMEARQRGRRGHRLGRNQVGQAAG